MDKSSEKETENLQLVSFTQMEGQCNCCRSKGHKSPQWCCKIDLTPNKEWAINKAQNADGESHAQVITDNGSVSSGSQSKNTSNKREVRIGWASAHIRINEPSANMWLFNKGEVNKMENWILLKNKLTDYIFCNPNYVTEIHIIEEGKTPLRLITNRGTIESNRVAKVPLFGDVWLNQNVITNFFSFAEMANKYWITYDNKNGKGKFIVHVSKEKDIPFKRYNGLYSIYTNPGRIKKSRLNSWILLKKIKPSIWKHSFGVPDVLEISTTQLELRPLATSRQLGRWIWSETVQLLWRT